MKEKIWIIIIGLMLLTGTLAAVPINASPATDNSMSVDKTMYISTMEDCPYYLNLTPIFGDGWADIEISNTEHLNVEVAGNKAIIGMEPNWNGAESFLMTATYYSVSPPPSNSIQSVSTYTLQVNMYVRPVNDPPYIKADAPSYYRVYGDSTTFANLYDVFGDIDSSSLTFEVSSSNSNITPYLKDSELQLTSANGYYGISTLNISASDGEYTTTYQLEVYATPDHNITLDEDNFMIAPVDDYLPAGWYKLDVVATDGIDAHYDSNMDAIVVTTKENWNGEGTVEVTGYYYSISPPDDGGICMSSQNTITLDIPAKAMPVNDPPYIKQEIKSAISFNEDTELSANLYDYFGDVDNDVLQFSATSSTPEVSVSIEDNGNITLTPQHNWDGNFYLYVSASDGEYTTEMPIPLNVAPTPDVSMKEDTEASIDLDRFFDSGWVSMTAETDNNISITIDGHIARFTPAPNWNGEENITFEATYCSGFVPYSSDAQTQPDAAPAYYRVSKTADIQVAPVNDAPVVKPCFPTYFEIQEDEVVTANLYNYFTDVDNSVLQFTAASTEGHVSFAIDSNGTISIEPEANWSGYTDIIVSAFDGELATSAVTTMAVSPSPDLVMQEDTPAVINLSDYFDPGWVSVSVTGDGEEINATVDPANGTIILDPALNWNGYTTLEIEVRYPTSFVPYGDGTLSAPGYSTVSKRADIVVEPVNDPPTQIKALPKLSTNEDTELSLNLNDYFTDVDSPLSFSIKTGNGITADFNRDRGILTIKPLPDWNGNTEIDITATDGEYSTSAEKALTVWPVNDAPEQISPLPEFQGDEDTAMTIDLNDYFVDVDSPLNFSVEPDGPLSISVNESGVATIVPSENWNGQTSLNIIVSDGEYTINAPATLNIKAVNDPPVELSPLSPLSFNEDGVAFIDLDDYFEDIDSPLSFHVTAGDGTYATVSPVNHILKVIGTPNWNGKTIIKITATDGEFSINSTESIDVLPVNDPPTVIKNIKTIKGVEDSVITLDLDDYFHDVDSPLKYSWDAPEYLNVTMDPESHVVTITPKSNWYGNTEITFTATDGSYSRTIKPTISIKNVEDAPMTVESKKVFKGRAGETLTVDLSTLFEDPDGDKLTYTVTSANGTDIPFTVDEKTHRLSIVLPEKADGTFILTVTASDGQKTASTEIYAVATPESGIGSGGTEEGVISPMSEGAVMALAIASSAALVGMLSYHTYQWRKYGNRKRELDL